MVEFIIKTLGLKARRSGPADKYYDAPEGPTHLDIEGFLGPENGTYGQIEKTLKKYGKEIINIGPYDAVEIKKDKIISSPIHSIFYEFNECLVTHGVSHSMNGLLHLIKAGSKLENKEKINETFHKLKWETDFGLMGYWKEWDEEKIIQMPTELKNINQTTRYFLALEKQEQI
jgi:hypothetical protein